MSSKKRPHPFQVSASKRLDDLSSLMEELLSDVKELSLEAKELKQMLLEIMERTDPNKPSETQPDSEVIVDNPESNGWFW
ncbi:hypothetical protein [Marinobacter sp.]|uniref:hypothetical protein n=1 Tax=Marinobacter sp. TaxID=50741 RepID=UPI00257D689D|nr:hypothetical protein [Marinobacter sp.]|tara:strand:+ start:250 stop:489 length:240 start_codon:yes stop_codon:yes gene_type:complete